MTWVENGWFIKTYPCLVCLIELVSEWPASMISYDFYLVKLNNHLHLTKSQALQSERSNRLIKNLNPLRSIPKYTSCKLNMLQLFYFHAYRSKKKLHLLQILKIYNKILVRSQNNHLNLAPNKLLKTFRCYCLILLDMSHVHENIPTWKIAAVAFEAHQRPMAWPVFQGMSACKHHPVRYTLLRGYTFANKIVDHTHTYIYIKIIYIYITYIFQDWKGYIHIYANTHYSTLLHHNITFHYSTIAIITIEVTIILTLQSNSITACTLHFNTKHFIFTAFTLHFHSVYNAFTCHLRYIYTTLTHTLHLHKFTLHLHFTCTSQLQYIYITITCMT